MSTPNQADRQDYSPYDDPDPRGTFTAALRRIADLVEQDEALPVPFSCHLLAGIYAHVGLDGSEAERFQALRGIAEHLGVDVVEAEGHGRTARLLIGPVEYTVYARADKRPVGPRPRVVPASEDI